MYTKFFVYIFRSLFDNSKPLSLSMDLVTFLYKRNMKLYAF